MLGHCAARRLSGEPAIYMVVRPRWAPAQDALDLQGSHFAGNALRKSTKMPFAFAIEFCRSAAAW